MDLTRNIRGDKLGRRLKGYVHDVICRLPRPLPLVRVRNYDVYELLWRLLTNVNDSFDERPIQNGSFKIIDALTGKPPSVHAQPVNGRRNQYAAGILRRTVVFMFRTRQFTPGQYIVSISGARPFQITRA